MLLTVVLLSGAVLAATSLVGLLILYQLRQATDIKGSVRAIFAADAGLEWAFFNETRPPAQKEPYPKIINFSNGAKVTVTYNPSDSLPIKSIGQYGRSARAFQANSPGGGGSKFDVILVLDRSASINDAELALAKVAANTFVDVVAPSPAGSHIGLVSFASNVTLDEHLTSSGTAVKTAINSIDNGGNTNLSEAIDVADGEFSDSHIPHERPEIKDIMIVITDGEPNRKRGGDAREARQAAKEEAEEARLASVEVYVVGVGVTPVTEEYLRTQIADDVFHYFSVADFNGLEDILKAVAEAILSTREVVP